MPFKLAHGIRACCVAGVLVTSAAQAAGGKPSLLGATRDQVLAKLGEPKSNIVAGNREVLFFAGERLVLRNNRVVEEEPIEAASPRPAPAKPAPAAADAQAPQAATAANPGPSASANGANGTASPDTSSANGAATASTPDAAATATPPAPAEPEVQIISVRPPSRTVAKPDVVVTPPAAPAAAASTTSPAPAGPSEAAAAPSGSAIAAAPQTDTPRRSAPPLSRGDSEPTRDPAAAPAAAAPSRAEVASTTPAPSSTPAAPATAATATTTSATPVASAPAAGSAEPNGPEAPALGRAGRPSLPTSAATPTAPASGTAAAAAKPSSAATQPATAVATSSASPVAPQQPADVPSHSSRLYLAVLAVVAAAGGFLVWRRRQRQIALVVTSVSNTPSVAAATPATATGVARFTPDLLGKLEWKRFEELVVSYYNKTGVVATRTKSGPANPVHVKISWKGEQRPFACVQCIAQPSGPIAAERVQALCDALTAEDIRRGYLVTSGKFSPPARDLADEKHLTLLAGDTFAEKLNALPDPVRSELWKEAMADDYATPTCPKCDVKMTRGLVEPWSCPQCGTPLPK